MLRPKRFAPLRPALRNGCGATELDLEERRTSTHTKEGREGAEHVREYQVPLFRDRRFSPSTIVAQNTIQFYSTIALARKFLGVIYHTLKNNWVFADFPNFVLAS